MYLVSKPTEIISIFKTKTLISKHLEVSPESELDFQELNSSTEINASSLEETDAVVQPQNGVR